VVNGSRYYRALESIGIASALSSLLPFSGGRPQRTVYPRRLPVNTVIHTTLVGLEPTTFRLLVLRATTSATDASWNWCTDKLNHEKSSVFYCKQAQPKGSATDSAKKVKWPIIIICGVCKYYIGPSATSLSWLSPPPRVQFALSH